MVGLTALWLSQVQAAQDVAPKVPELAWDWSASHRYYLDTEVRLPYMMWFFRQFNEQARVTVFRVRLVADCVPSVQGKKRAEVFCTLEDVGLTASGFTQERGLLQPILEELDDRLTGSRVQLQVRNDGRLVNIDLEDLDRRNRRVGAMNENLRLVVSRAFAGLDLPLPRRAEDTTWVQNDSWLLKAPAVQGSLGTAEIVHKRNTTSNHTVAIASAGRGVIVPSDSGNQYDAVYEGRATFDVDNGRLLDRNWSVVATPTPSSIVSEGLAGYPYLQMGRIMSLPPGERVDVGDTMELEPIDGPTALQQWQVLGLVPQ